MHSLPTLIYGVLILFIEYCIYLTQNEINALQVQ